MGPSYCTSSFPRSEAATATHPAELCIPAEGGTPINARPLCSMGRGQDQGAGGAAEHIAGGGATQRGAGAREGCTGAREGCIGARKGGRSFALILFHF